jgi:TonB family protein
MNAPFRPEGGAEAAPIASPHSPSPELRRYLRRAQARAGTLLRRAGVDIAAYTVAVRAEVSFEGAVTDVQIVRSSGSWLVDDALEAVLRRILRNDPPSGLVGGAITLRLGPSPRTPAKAS